MSLKPKHPRVNGVWIANTDLGRDARTQIGVDLVTGVAVLDHLTPRQAAAITGVAEREIKSAASQSTQSR
jgi:hypothetical protein